MITSRKRFEKIILPHLSACYNLALWMLRDPTDAEDVVQTAYLNAFEQFERFIGGNSAAWIMTIVRNTAINQLNKKKRNDKLIEFNEYVHTPDNGSRQALAYMNPEELTSLSASYSKLLQCINRLPLEFRESIYLREVEGYSYKEIADITQVAKGTVMSRLSRARHQLQILLYDEQRKENQSREL